MCNLYRIITNTKTKHSYEEIIEPCNNGVLLERLFEFELTGWHPAGYKMRTCFLCSFLHCLRYLIFEEILTNDVIRESCIKN